MVAVQLVVQQIQSQWSLNLNDAWVRVASTECSCWPVIKRRGTERWKVPFVEVSGGYWVMTRRGEAVDREGPRVCMCLNAWLMPGRPCSQPCIGCRAMHVYSLYFLVGQLHSHITAWLYLRSRPTFSTFNNIWNHSYLTWKMVHEVHNENVSGKIENNNHSNIIKSIKTLTVQKIPQSKNQSVFEV